MIDLQLYSRAIIHFERGILFIDSCTSWFFFFFIHSWIHSKFRTVHSVQNRIAHGAASQFYSWSVEKLISFRTLKADTPRMNLNCTSGVCTFSYMCLIWVCLTERCLLVCSEQYVYCLAANTSPGILLSQSPVSLHSWVENGTLPVNRVNSREGGTKQKKRMRKITH